MKRFTQATAEERAAELRSQGFDRSRAHNDDGRWTVIASCGQCDAVRICGVATHETGCPNARRAREVSQ